MKETQEEYMVRVGKFIDSGLLMSGAFPKGRLMSVERPWTEIFIICPTRTISGKWVYMEKAFKRRVWRSTGFAEEPFTEYATLFDMLRADSESI